MEPRQWQQMQQRHQLRIFGVSGKLCVLFCTTKIVDKIEPQDLAVDLYLIQSMSPTLMLDLFGLLANSSPLSPSLPPLSLKGSYGSGGSSCKSRGKSSWLVRTRCITLRLMRKKLARKFKGNVTAAGSYIKFMIDSHRWRR
ncbi:hypothetical protein AgCh_035778 [Apium graveolens]